VGTPPRSRELDVAAIAGSFQLWQIEDEDFRVVLTRRDGEACFVLQRYSVSGACGLAIDVDRSLHGLHPALAVRCQRMPDTVTCSEERVVDLHVLFRVDMPAAASFALQVDDPVRVVDRESLLHAPRVRCRWSWAEKNCQVERKASAVHPFRQGNLSRDIEGRGIRSRVLDRDSS
jgi:hypothetical protein